jgi:hypothetical protein
MADVPARGADHFLPTEADRILLEQELENEIDPNIDARLHQWEAQLVVWTQKLAATSLDSGGVAELTIDDALGAPLARLSVCVETTEGVLFDVLLEVEPINFAATSEMEWAEHVMLCALNPSEQQWDSTYMGKGRAYSACSVTIDSLVEEPQSYSVRAQTPAAGRSAAGVVAHFAHRERLVDCMVDGEAVRAVCGKWFVPRQDPETRDVCPTCELVIAHVSPND